MAMLQGDVDRAAGRRPDRRNPSRRRLRTSGAAQACRLHRTAGLLPLKDPHPGLRSDGSVQILLKQQFIRTGGEGQP